MHANPTVVPVRARLSRRDAVLARLASVTNGGSHLEHDERWASNLRQAAEDLGPVFTAFADYLSTRIDLLPVVECRELGAVHAPPPTQSVAQLQRIIAAENAGQRRGFDLSPEPLSVTAWSQTHAACLETGEPVRVEVVTITEETAAVDLALLALVQRVCSGRIAPALLRSALADFRLRFEATCDCRRRIADAVAATIRIEPALSTVVPRPIAERCSRRVLVCEEVAADRPADARAASDLRDQPDAAVCAISSWLRVALSGSVFPILTADSRRRADGMFVATGALARLPPAAGAHLTEYLLAVAADSPDRACDALVHDLTPLDDAAPLDEVARAFRRLVPFRDDRSCDSGSEVADCVFLQWRVATRHGWVPATYLVPFYQGLFGLVTAMRDETGGRDVVAEAVCGLRFDAGVRYIEEWTRNLDMTSAMERHMLLLMQLPGKLDRLLTIAADGTVRVQVGAADRPRSRYSRARFAVALLLVVLSAALLAGVPGIDARSDAAQSIGFVAAGALLVWAVGRVR